jgi:hypothetical protein
MFFVLDKLLTSSHKTRISIIGAVLYILAPYHVSLLLGLQSVGSFYALIFAPLVFLGLYYLINQKNSPVVPLAVGVSGLIITHTLSALIIFVFSVVFLAINWRKIQGTYAIKKALLAGLVSLGLTAFFVLPLLEARQVGIYYLFSDTACISFRMPNCRGIETYSIKDIVHSGTLLLSTIFIAGTAALCLIMRKKLENKVEKRYLLQGIAISLVVIVLMMKVVPYEQIRVFDSLQFSWRFLVIPTVICPIVISFLVSKTRLPLRFYDVVLLSLVPLTIVYAQAYMFMSRGVVEFVSEAPASVSEARENLPQAFSIEEIKGVELPRVAAGEATISDFSKNGSHINLKIASSKASSIELPAIYYPGYQAFLSEEPLKTSPSDNGLLLVEVPSEGRGNIRVHYGMTVATAFGLTISLITGILGIICIAHNNKPKRADV